VFNALAERVGGEVASHSLRPYDSVPHRFTLSPHSYVGVKAGTRVVLPSPNGSTCCQYGARAAALFVGALVNAEAVGGAVSYLLTAAGQLNATILACGERWRDPDEEGVMRFALEDYLGAGAVLSTLLFPQTIEAQACAATFQAMQDRLEAALWECESGQELRAKGLGEDVRYAARLNILTTAPMLRGERLEIFLPATRDESYDT
jgi:2-phosphosulfolactate phosphatase